jgi:broad specificity phosphatase PhoE
MSISEWTLITPSSIDRTHNLRDPPLMDKGFAQAEDLGIQLSTIWKIKPSAIVTSPMTRTIQTVRTLFPSDGSDAIPLRIWPDLREAHDANCNQGRSRAEMQALHSDLDFSACDEEWNYNPHRFADAADRAEAVRKELMKLPGPHVVLVGHRGFIAYLVDTHQVKFRNCGAYCICLYDFPGFLS